MNERIRSHPDTDMNGRTQPRQGGLGGELAIVGRRAVAVVTGLAGAVAIFYDLVSVLVGVVAGQGWQLGAIATLAGLGLAGAVLLGIGVTLYTSTE